MGARICLLAAVPQPGKPPPLSERWAGQPLGGLRWLPVPVCVAHTVSHCWCKLGHSRPLASGAGPRGRGHGPAAPAAPPGARPGPWAPAAWADGPGHSGPGGAWEETGRRGPQACRESLLPIPAPPSPQDPWVAGVPAGQPSSVPASIPPSLIPQVSFSTPPPRQSAAPSPADLSSRSCRPVTPPDSPLTSQPPSPLFSLASCPLPGCSLLLTALPDPGAAGGHNRASEPAPQARGPRATPPDPAPPP